MIHLHTDAVIWEDFFRRLDRYFLIHTASLNEAPQMQQPALSVCMRAVGSGHSNAKEAPGFSNNDDVKKMREMDSNKRIYLPIPHIANLGSTCFTALVYANNSIFVC